MDIRTSRFGTIRISSSDVICFPSGLGGFEDCRSWVLLMEQAGDGVVWLQSTQAAEVALPVVDPKRFMPNYKLSLSPLDWNPLGIRNSDPLQVLVTAARHDSLLSLNLLAPLAINRRRRLGRQVINVGEWPVSYVAHDLTPATKRIA